MLGCLGGGAVARIVAADRVGVRAARTRKPLRDQLERRGTPQQRGHGSRQVWRLRDENAEDREAAAVMGILLVVALWPEAIEVEVGTVTRGALVVTLDEEGETRVHHRFIVSAPVGGTLERIELEPGNGVELGKTVVARLRPEAPPQLDARSRMEAAAAVTAARNTVGRARAEQQRARAALDLANQELKREQELFDKSEILQRTLANMGEGIMVCDRDLKLIGWNDRVVELLDLPQGFLRTGLSYEAYLRLQIERGEFGKVDADEEVRKRLTTAMAPTPGARSSPARTCTACRSPCTRRPGPSTAALGARRATAWASCRSTSARR